MEPQHTFLDMMLAPCLNLLYIFYYVQPVGRPRKRGGISRGRISTATTTSPNLTNVTTPATAVRRRPGRPPGRGRGRRGRGRPSLTATAAAAVTAGAYTEGDQSGGEGSPAGGEAAADTSGADSSEAEGEMTSSPTHLRQVSTSSPLVDLRCDTMKDIYARQKQLDSININTKGKLFISVFKN